MRIVIKCAVMDLLQIILIIVIVGLILWLINRFIPMSPGAKQILNVAAVILLIIWLLFICAPFLRSVRF